MSNFDGSHFDFEANSTNAFSKNKHRQLGIFFSQELLYDYVVNKLDTDRRLCLEQELKLHPELVHQIELIRQSIQFCESLSKDFVIRDSAIEKMKNSATLIESILKKIHFQQWPKGLKMSLESLGLALLIMIIGWSVPWNKISSLKFGTTNEVILAEVNRQFLPKETNLEHSKKETELPFPDEGIVNIATTSTTLTAGAQIIIPTVSLPKFTEASTTTTMAVAKKANTSAALVAGNPAVSDSVNLPTGSTSGSESNLSVAATESAAAMENKKQGYLFRGNMKISNVTAINPKLIEKIEVIGGRKAGGVPLGWQKGNGSYFHFTVPELKYEEVIKIFAEYGKVQIQREKHDRVMPEGIIRIIIDVDEASPQ